MVIVPVKALQPKKVSFIFDTPAGITGAVDIEVQLLKVHDRLVTVEGSIGASAIAEQL